MPQSKAQIIPNNSLPLQEGGNRWSKPHVATLSLHSLFELRSLIVNGAVCLDVAANNLDTVCELVLDNMVNTGAITFDKKAIVKDAILKRHRSMIEPFDSPKVQCDHGGLAPDFIDFHT